MTSPPSPRKLGRSPRIELQIPQEVIANATTGDSAHCMIADAIAAQIPDAKSITVDLQTIRWSNRKRGERYIYLTPPDAQDALVLFDQGYAVEPFSIRLARGQVTRIKAGSKKQVEDREARKATIAAKEAAGEPLTAPEKRAKVRLERHEAQAQRPLGLGPTEQIFEQGTPVRRGGPPPPVAVLSNAKGRARVFGLKTLKRADGGPLTVGLREVDEH